MKISSQVYIPQIRQTDAHSDMQKSMKCLGNINTSSHEPCIEQTVSPLTISTKRYNCIKKFVSDTYLEGRPLPKRNYSLPTPQLGSPYI